MHAAGVVIEREIEINTIEHQGVAERNKLCAFLRALDAGNPRHRKHVAFGVRTLAEQAQGFGLHADAGCGDRLAPRFRLGPHVHHARCARRIEVRQLRHDIISFPGSNCRGSVSNGRAE